LDFRALAPALFLLLAAAPAAPQSPPPGTQPGSPETAPQVELDRLLKLPAGSDYSLERRGGLTPGEWRARFQEIQTALEAEREALAVAEADLDRVAGSADAWQVGPPIPGMSGAGSDAPLDYRIRQTINRHRLEIDRLERQLRSLEVEANLAGVPEDWRQ
jgi:hypothetical protein